MARRTEKKEETLLTLIPEFGELKVKADDYKKQADTKNKAIKKLMAAEKLEEKEVEGWVANYSVRTTSSYDEEGMMEALKTYWIKQHGSEMCPFIKTKEYIDEEVLEEYIYHGKLPKRVVASLDKFRTVKETEYLTIKRTKG